jgi:hypothetical protein
VAKALGWNAPDGEGRKPGERTGLDTRVGTCRGLILCNVLTLVKIIPKYLSAAVPRRVPAVNDAG